jgi:hypothetical protein
MTTTTISKPIPQDLLYLLNRGPTSAKELARLYDKSESRMREILKQHAAEINCKKDTAGINVFWIEPAPADEAVADSEAVAEVVADGDEPVCPVTPRPEDDGSVDVPALAPAETPVNTPEAPAGDVVETAGINEAVEGSCPFCIADESFQTQAGEEGTFLGACRTCKECGKTYNVLTGDEIHNAPAETKTKRVPINPQHKIDAKVEAVEGAGGKLAFSRDSRKWVLDLNGKTIEMTAKEFSIETPESILLRK